MTAQTYTTAAPCTNVKRLQNAIIDMDSQAQTGFDEIEAIASLVLSAMESPERYPDDEDIAQALIVIMHKASEIKNDINYAAEVVGCNYKDESTMRRYEAYRANEEKRRGLQSHAANGGEE
ncbi:hypothetical protein [Methylomonas sp. HYX-M1]|uniref:hypothetical protein n=1 Tax=Methylomonas sp. HYX-M1 TaxID=3139307 RepID=UPI00345BD948